MGLHTDFVFGILFFTLFAVIIKAQSTSSACAAQETCGGCIAAGPNCAWCSAVNFTQRCDLLVNLGPAGCDSSEIVNTIDYQENVKNLTLQNAIRGDEAVQLYPQEVNVKMRPSKPFSMDVTFRLAEDYPVDLYYVMDLSKSMDDDKDKLAELGTDLVEALRNITKNVYLGFGSFVDKKTMPYVSVVPSHLERPCDGCVAPYGFHHQMPLGDDTGRFRDKVRNANISGNLDGPEGGFDAVMQAIACEHLIGWRNVSRRLLILSTDADFHMAGDGKSRIGWRNHSRKMLLFSTDADFHYAGDGKLGGIVDPNDGHCHMDTAGYYTESLNQDYPSISQLSHKIAEKKVNVIFAITREQVPVYERLSKFIEGSKVGELADDSGNVVELVEENYNEISSTVELKTSGAEGITVIFESECTDNVTRERSKCEDLKIGQSVTFKVKMEVTECPADRSLWKRSFDIYPVGLTEKLRVNLDLACECDCEVDDSEQPNSPHCNNNGTYECGACTCHDGRYGSKCECDGSNIDSADYDVACKKTNTSLVCEGQGTCVCGKCECDRINPNQAARYSGKFCECNNYACNYIDGQLCGGPSRGKCVCGECACNSQYTGDSCNCPISQESCRASNGEICNGKGECICGKCKCTIDNYFRPPTCEDCPTCPGQCEKNKACVQCRAFQSGELSQEYCDANCTHVRIVPTIEESRNKKMCRFQDDDDCMFSFTYDYNSLDVEAQRTKECPTPVNILAIVLGVIGGILLVGILLLLIWKLLDTIHYRRECAQFKKELENAKWDASENPIFKEATSTFQNPTYQKSGVN